MNLTKKLVFSLGAVLALSACSSDEPGNTPDINADGTKAYLKVNIQSVAGTRGTEGNYVYGDADEHATQNAHFYFFDANGVFVGTANIWRDGALNTNGNQNIEYMGNNVIVLENLRQNNYPNYMLTVLNIPAGFNPIAGQTIEQVTTELSNFTDADEDGNFVMSTSAYYSTSETDHSNTFYNVTKIQDGNFALQPADLANLNPVEVYVERLAAKVQLSTVMGQAVNPTNLYPVKVTLFGEENAEYDNTNINAGTELYVKVLGWGLNATAPKSYIGKQLISTWNTSAPFANWNKPADFRSYWAKSVLYAANGTIDAPIAPAGLIYTSYDKLVSNVGGAEYCNEYTNVPANIFKKSQDALGNAVYNVIPANVTSILVKAEVCDVNGNALDLVSFNGSLFTKEQYQKYVLGSMKNDQKLNFYTKTTTDGTDSYTVFSDFTKFEWVAANQGTGTIKLNVTDASVELYSYNAKTGKYVATDNAAFNAALDEYQANMKAVAYNGGKMYYNIPVEHFAAENATTGKYTEGYYGVVRNHWYQIDVTKIAHIGHGIFSGTETIIPDEPEDPYYYLAAHINILAWKIVKQNSEL